VIDQDESLQKIKLDKIPGLKPAFKADGTVTAANASSLNDGGSAMIITSEEFADKHGLKPLGYIRGYADAAKESVDFTTAPSLAVPKALKMAGLDSKDIDYHEVNEAFAVVALANANLLNIPIEKLNVRGGAVALGHPIGSSGLRIMVSLLNILHDNDASFGCASICNGGGGASAIVLERA
jgi:acetyl-CoA C-acetyltransferase